MEVSTSVKKELTDAQTADRLTLAAGLIAAPPTIVLLMMFWELRDLRLAPLEGEQFLYPLLHLVVTGLLFWWAEAIRAGTLPRVAQKGQVLLGLAFLAYAVFLAFFSLVAFVWGGLFGFVVVLMAVGCFLAAKALLGKASASLVATS